MSESTIPTARVFVKSGGYWEAPGGGAGWLRLISDRTCGREHCYLSLRLEWMRMGADGPVVADATSLETAVVGRVRDAHFGGGRRMPTRGVGLRLAAEDPRGRAWAVLSDACLVLGEPGEATLEAVACRDRQRGARGAGERFVLRADDGSTLALRRLAWRPDRVLDGPTPDDFFAPSGSTYFASARQLLLHYRTDEVVDVAVVPGRRGRQLLAVHWSKGPPGTCVWSEELHLYLLLSGLDPEDDVLLRLPTVPLANYLDCAEGPRLSCGCGTWRARWSVELRGADEIVLVTHPEAETEREGAAAPPPPTEVQL
ncbi:MAG: hypothetical protein AAGH15_12110 [Myxococcota bacterium]